MPQPKIQFFGNDGKPLSGGLLYTYYPGTAVPKASYTTYSGTQNTNPVVLDSQGRASVWFDGAYDVVLKAADGTTILTQQNVSVASTPSMVDVTNIFVGFGKITVSETAPTNPSQNELWVDISV